MKINKDEKKLFKEIESGKYSNHYLVYNRKSTDEANNQKNSIQYQRAENTRFAKNKLFQIAPLSIKNLCLNGVISERHSGFKESDEFVIDDDGAVKYYIERPKFQKMLQFLNQGYFKGVVCLCWDRISRNRADDTIIRKLMRRSVDIRFVYAHYDKTSAGALHMDVDSMFSAHHSRVTSEKVSVATRNCRERGICTYKAPIGYLNQGNMDSKPFDPERASIIKKIYELCAEGDWTLSDLARYANEQGLTTVPMRRKRTEEEKLAEEDEMVEIEKVSRPITQNHISRMLTNPFYTGKIIDSDGNYIKSNSHKALVSEELFNKVQEQLKRRKVSLHYDEKLDLPLRGFMRCSKCNRAYTPYVKKGIQYYNARCVNGCENKFKNFNFNFIENKIEKLIKSLYFTEDELAEVDARLSTEISLVEEKRQKDIDKIERRKKKIREDLKYLNTNKLILLRTGAYTPEGFLEEEQKLNDELNTLKERENTSDEAMRETMEDITKLSELLKNAVPYYNFANPREKEVIIKIIFSELYISKNTLEYKLQNGFLCFENRFNAICDPTGSRTRIAGLKSRCPNH